MKLLVSCSVLTAAGVAVATDDFQTWPQYLGYLIAVGVVSLLAGELVRSRAAQRRALRRMRREAMVARWVADIDQRQREMRL